MNRTEAYRASRDQLLTLRGEHSRAVREFRWPELGEEFNWAVDWFDAVARDVHRPALVIVEEDGSSTERTFDEICRSSDRLAQWLADRGVRRGDPVLIMLGNQVELWESMLAVMKVGAVLVPIAGGMTLEDLGDRVARSRARHVLCNAHDARRFESISSEVTRFSVGPADGWSDIHDARNLPWRPTEHPRTSIHDPVLLYFTSGTTSRPKLVEHSQVSYPVGHLTTMYFLGLRPGDIHLNISSPGWAKHAWSCFFAPWIAEATVFVYNYTRFDATQLLKHLRERNVNSFCAPPTVWRMLVNTDLGDKPGGLREAIGAGEPLNPEVIEQVQRAWGLIIRDGFGQTETTAQIANTPESPVKLGSMGRPLPGVPVVLVDTVTGIPLEGAGEGEICIDLSRNPVSLMRGYQRDHEVTARAMAGGFYHTGDIAIIDEEGYIFYIGRTDDVFKASDYKISPFELESVLIEHPAVAEAAVVPAPDAIRLAVPKAYVTLAPGYEPTEATAFEILKHARDQLNPYQRVRRIEFSELPKTISGKIRRVELRARAADAASGGAPPTEFRDDQFPELRT